MGEKVTLTIEVRARPGKINELCQTLQAFLPTMRREKGCLNCRVSRDMEDSELYLFSSNWDTPATFEGYMRTGNGSILLGALDLLGESTRVQVGDDAKWEGLERLQRIRRS